MELKKLNSILNSFKTTSVKEITLESKLIKLHIVKGVATSKQFESKIKKSLITPIPLVEETKITDTTETNKQIPNDIVSKHVGYFSRFNPKEKKQIIKLRDIIKKGDLVAIVKAAHVEHKVFAEKSGKIIEFLVEEGQPVEYGQPLIRLEKK